MTELNLKVLLAARPDGAVSLGDFAVVEEPVMRPGNGQLLLRNLFLSIDPFIRVRMNGGKSYASNLEIGDVMVGDTLAEVVESRHPDFREGDKLVGRLGWQRYAVSDGTGLRRISPSLGPLSSHLGVLGMPGVTAWYGLLKLGRPLPGQTVVVAAASGAVGSAVGQIANLKGCRVVGIAGGQDKCRHVVDELAFDECIDHRSETFAAQLRQAAPNGVDIYFDTVGGKVLDVILPLCNDFARIPLCGMITGYDGDSGPGIQNLYSAIAHRVTLEGFIISDHSALWPEALADLSNWISHGKLKYRETVYEGLMQAPDALIGLLKGANLGKQIVRID